MLSDYIEPSETFVTCPNQDVVYGLGFGRSSTGFWQSLLGLFLYEFGEIGKPYNSKPGFYLLVGPNWKGAKPASITEVIRCSTELANAIPRVFMDDTPEDRKVNQIVFYPLKLRRQNEDDRLEQSPGYPRVAATGHERKWVKPEKFFQSGEVSDKVGPLPGERAPHGQFDAILDAATNDPSLKKVLVDTAVETQEKVIEPFFAWKRNGRPADGLNRATSGAARRR